jgi:hypothetical protein
MSDSDELDRILATGSGIPAAHDDARADDRVVNPEQQLVSQDIKYQKRIQEWVETHWKHGPCPVCESNSYTTGAVAEVPAYNPRSTPFDRKAVLPVFPAFCTVCGYVIWINAVAANVVRAEEDGLTAVQVFGDRS